MIFHLITWVITVFAVVGTIANIYKKRWCFIIWTATNTSWCIVNWHKGIYAASALFGIYAVLAVWGWCKWKADKQPKEGDGLTAKFDVDKSIGSKIEYQCVNSFRREFQKAEEDLRKIGTHWEDGRYKGISFNGKMLTEESQDEALQK